MQLVPAPGNGYKERVLVTYPKKNVSQYFYSRTIGGYTQKVIEVDSSNYIKLEDGSLCRLPSYMLDTNRPSVGDVLLFSNPNKESYYYTHYSYPKMPPLFTDYDAVVFRDGKRIGKIFVGMTSREKNDPPLPKDHRFIIKFGCPGDFNGPGKCNEHVTFDRFWPELNFAVVSADKREKGYVVYTGHDGLNLHFKYDDGSKITVKPLFNGLPHRFSPITPGI